MKKILSLLAVLAVSSQCVSAVNACNNQKPLKLNPVSPFESDNLNTWGKAQKAIINKAYLKVAAQSHLSTWGGWIKHVNKTSSMEEKGLTKALQKINPCLHVVGIRNNIKASYLHAPSNKDSLKKVLAQGVMLHLEALWELGEELNVEIKGFIPKPKQTPAWIIAPNYSREKKILSDPHSAPQKDPILLPTGGADKILPNEWDKDQVSYTLNSSWSSMGGLDDGLDSYATYKKVTIIKGKPVLCEMYLPKLGFTKENPVYFYVKGI